MTIRRDLALTAVVVLALAAGCAGQSSPLTGSAGATRVHTVGSIVTVGGQAPGSPRPIAGAELQLVGEGTSAAIHADSAGRFSVDLPPGRYRVVITGHAPSWDGGWLPAMPSAVTIRAHAPPVRLVVSIK